MAGNATITTLDGNGSLVTTDLWLQSVQSSSDVEFDDNQVHRGMSFRPIRRLEMFLDFTAVWSLANYNLMDNFQEALRTHYQQIIAGNSTPMTLNYCGTDYVQNNLVYQGWVERADKIYPRFEDIFVRSYRMNILSPETTGTILPVSSVDTANYLTMFGTGWYQQIPSSEIYTGGTLHKKNKKITNPNKPISFPHWPGK